MAAVPGWLLSVSADDLRDATSRWSDAHARAAAWAIWRQGIGPLLCRRLAEQGALGVLPELLQGYLTEELEFSGQRSEVLLADLVAILELASRAGIVVVPLKGSLLALLYYESPALRPMADLDLLVQSADEPRLAELAGERGYVVSRRRSRHLVLSREGKSHSDVVRLGEHPGNPMHLEIHRTVSGDHWGLQYRLTEAMWADSEPGELAGAPARLLHPRALMRHLLVHAGANMMNRTLRAVHLYDLTVLGRYLDAADWERLAAEAGRSGEGRLLYAPLALLQRWLGGQVAPEPALEQLAAATPPRLVRFVQQAPLARMTICGYSFPPRGRAPIQWYFPGREWLGAIKHGLLQAAGEPSPPPGSAAPRRSRAAVSLRRLARLASFPPRYLRRRLSSRGEGQHVGDAAMD